MGDEEQFSEWLDKSNHDAKFIRFVRRMIESLKEVREINALMAEGEGSGVDVYKTMARDAMSIADRALMENKKIWVAFYCAACDYIYLIKKQGFPEPIAQCKHCVRLGYL